MSSNHRQKKATGKKPKQKSKILSQQEILQQHPDIESGKALSEAEYLKTAEGQKELQELWNRFEADATVRRNLREALAGDDDDSWTRFLLEMRKWTGMTKTEVNRIHSHEFRQVARAAIKMKSQQLKGAQNPHVPALSDVQSEILEACAGRRLFQVEIAEIIESSQKTVSRECQKLETQGLLCRPCGDRGGWETTSDGINAMLRAK